jgi:hypothetical protein
MPFTLNRGGLAAPSYAPATTRRHALIAPARAGTRGFPSSHPGGGFGGGGGGGLVGGDGRPMMPPGMGGPGGAPGQGGSPSWDPENLLGAPQRGLINKSLVKQRVARDKEFAKAVERVASDEQKAAMLRRASRTPPAAGEHAELVEFFLDTQADDMEFEVARCRPLCTADFFRDLDAMLGEARFGNAGNAIDGEPDEDRVAELETLRQYLEEAVEAIDRAVKATSTAADRMKTLLEAKDKKQAILALAEANLIDQALVDLLQTNADAARQAGQEQAAVFMEKVKQAVSKYLVTGPSGGAGSAVMPAVPAALAGGGGEAAAATPSGLLVAGAKGTTVVPIGGGGGGKGGGGGGGAPAANNGNGNGGGGSGLIL